MTEITVTRGYVAIVDDKNFEWLNSFSWHIGTHGNCFYAITYIKRKAFPMHRLILGVTDRNIFVDHKDGNGLNNQEDNLRIATRSQNMANRRLHKSKTSKYLGVSWYPRTKQWEVQIRKDLKKIYIGQFTTEEDAAMAYNEAAIKHHGEFARLNVIIKPPVETRGFP